jgi:rieske iron-sulfur protein
MDERNDSGGQQMSEAEESESTVPPSVQPLPQAAVTKKPLRRRGFIKLLAAVGVLIALTPFVTWGQYLSASIKGSQTYGRQKVVIDNNSVYEAAAGKTVNVNDLDTFPPNSHWVITYPSSGDSTLDAQNTDTFTKFELIRLPKELGGEQKDATSFAAFSKVCVHLWCSPNYIPGKGHEQYECPCHGSVYEIPDGLAIAGPASLQPVPTNAIPILTLSTDKDGTLNIEPPIWDPEHNGILGYGRYVPGKTGA